MVLRTARWMFGVIRVGPVRLLQSLILSAAVLMLTTVARDAPGNSAAAAGTPIDIPSGVFIALERPDWGRGPARETKHSTYAHNPIDGRLYQMGGDFGGTVGGSSYRQDMYSVSIAERWASRNDRNAGWRQEYPYCGPEGGRQPKSPDYVGWTWDSKRRVFWSVPGTFVIPAAVVCPGITSSWADDPPKYLFNHLMTFDPFEPDLTQRWQDRGRDIGPTAVDTWMSVYDAGTDSLIRFGWDGARGAMVNIYDITAGQWTAKLLGLNAVGQDIRIFKEMLAADWGQRVIYVIDGIAGRLHRYRVDGRTIEDLGAVPGGPIAYTANNDAYAVWDSLHRVLFFFRMDTSILHVYHPDTQEWETPPLVTDPPGLTPHVRHAAVFDPDQNVLVLLGTTDANPYMYLYRYAPGLPHAPGPPPAPESLRVF